METYKYSNTRLLDILFLGPLQILISSYTQNKFLKLFVFITGYMNILYNANNYLYLDLGVVDKSYLNFLDNYFVSENGKTQYHRIYNLVIMYPVFFYVWKYEKNIPKTIKDAFIIEITLGFLYNLYNFILIKNT